MKTRFSDRTAQTCGNGRHLVEDCLYLHVRGPESRTWLFRYQIDGKRRDMSLGKYPEITLKQAKVQAAQAHEDIANGLDPIEKRKKDHKNGQSAPTFEEVAKEVIGVAKKKTKNEKVAYQWGQHLSAKYCSKILKKPVNEISSTDLGEILEPIWHVKPEVARKLKGKLHQVFAHAKIILRDKHGIIMHSNPANHDDLKALGYGAPPQLTRGHQASVHYTKMPRFMNELRKKATISAKALEFLILTVGRTKTVLEAVWDQIDFENKIWMPPIQNLKDKNTRTEFLRIPLCNRAIQILEEMRKITGSEYIFPGTKRGKHLSYDTMGALIDRMNFPVVLWYDEDSKVKATPHGFRASFKTWAADETTYPRAVVEEAMGHVFGSATERAYNRTDHLNKRVSLLNEWERFLNGPQHTHIAALNEQV